MECKLRRNVMQRDWLNGVDRYYAQCGRRPERVIMNYRTYYLLIKYIERHAEWLCNLTVSYYTDTHNDNIEFNGVEIYFSYNVKDEMMRIW